MKLGMGEILKEGSKLEGEAQIEYMRKNFSPTFGKMIEYALEPEYEWDLPPGRPPFKENKFLDQESNLYNDVRRMYIFMKGEGDHVSPLKKEINFVQMLESVSTEDANFLLHAKEKTLPYGWTADKIREVYPGLIWAATKEQAEPDLTATPETELGKTAEEEIGEPAPLPFTEDDLIKMATGPVIEAPVLSEPLVPTEPVLTKKQLAMAKARETRKANLAAKNANT